ncbi:MAG: hypothetical protein IPP99_21420 [Chitinophagaceae bacterium]|nr:hypothetical protein [Chitinophagaceae bacterium]MBP6590497.1 hypothetical protein [Chitinophagaceae bacterium]
MASHEDKFISKLLFGFGAIIAAVMLTLFVCAERIPKKDEWYWWGMAIAAILCTGIFLVASALIHKMKSDMIRKQKMRHLQRGTHQETASDIS